MTALRFRQADVSRAVKGAKAAGMAVGRVEIDASGKIVLIAAAQEAVSQESPLEKWKAKRNAGQA